MCFLLLFIKLWSAIKNFSTNLRVDFFCVFTKLDLFFFLNRIPSVKSKENNRVLHQKEVDIGLMAPPGGVLGLCLNMVHHDS